MSTCKKNKNEISRIISETSEAFKKADQMASIIASEAQKYIDWDYEITCVFENDEIYIDSFCRQIPAEKFFRMALEKGTVSEEDFISLI